MATGKKPPVELDERGVQNALYAIGQPESWEELVKVGTAVKSAVGENGRAMFVEWAENSHWGRSNSERKERHNFSNNYSGFNTQKVGAGTLVWLANDRTGGEFSRQNAKGDFQVTAEYEARQAARRQQIAAEQQAADRLREERNAQTVQNIQGWFTPNALRANASHPYLKKKGVDNPPPQLTYYKNRVQIPLYDKDGNIVAAQAIHGRPPEGMPQKQVYGSFKGASFMLGDMSQAQNGVIMAEGFATAYSLHKATGLPVIMAVSSSNFDDVAAVYREKLPNGVPFIIAADNDANKVGFKAAEKAAEVYGKDAIIQMAQFDEATQNKFQRETGGNPTDFNDLALYGSYAAVKAQIDEALTEHQRRQQQAVEAAPTTENPQQEKNIMDNNETPQKSIVEQPAFNPDNINDVRQMRESDFRQMLANELQQGTLMEKVNRLDDRFHDDFLENNLARFSASYELSQRMSSTLKSLSDNEQTQAAREILARMERNVNNSDDPAIQEISDRIEHLSKQWQPETENQQQAHQTAHTEPQKAEVIEAPAAVQTAAEESSDEKETHLKHFRENMEMVKENQEQQAESSADFLDDLQHMAEQQSFSSVDDVPPPSDEDLMRDIQRMDSADADPATLAPTPEPDEPLTNEDGTNSVEQTPKVQTIEQPIQAAQEPQEQAADATQPEKSQTVKQEQPQPQEMTAQEYQEKISIAYEDGTLQKDFQKLADKMEKAKTPETFREHYTDFSRMRNAIMELEAGENGNFREQDAVKWTKLTSAIAAGLTAANTRGNQDEVFQAAIEDGNRRAQQFKADENAPKPEPVQQPEKEQPHIITEAEALRNLNRSRVETDDTALLRREEQPQQQEQTAGTPKAEKPLTVEQPQIQIPKEVTELYLINRDKTELYNERTGETQIYINSEKNQLKTKHSDFDTVEAMIKIAEKNQWTSITVKGTPEFRKLAWEMAAMQGIEVKGYKPNKQEIAVMEARKARLDEMKATNRIEGERTTQQQTQDPMQAKTRIEQPNTRQNETQLQDNRNERHVRDKTDLPQMYYETMNAGFGAGTVANLGSKVHPSAQNDPHAKKTPFIELETASGQRHTVWGVALRDLIDQKNIQVGDRLALRVNGTEFKSWTENGREQSGERKRWIIEDLVQSKREERKQEPEKRTEKTTQITPEIVKKVAEKAVQQGQKVTAYQPIEQTKLQSKQGETQKQGQSQEQKPRMVSR